MWCEVADGRLSKILFLLSLILTLILPATTEAAKRRPRKSRKGFPAKNQRFFRPQYFYAPPYPYNPYNAPVQNIADSSHNSFPPQGTPRPMGTPKPIGVPNSQSPNRNASANANANASAEWVPYNVLSLMSGENLVLQATCRVVDSGTATDKTYPVTFLLRKGSADSVSLLLHSEGKDDTHAFTSNDGVNFSVNTPVTESAWLTGRGTFSTNGQVIRYVANADFVNNKVGANCYLQSHSPSNSSPQPVPPKPGNPPSSGGTASSESQGSPINISSLMTGDELTLTGNCKSTVYDRFGGKVVDTDSSDLVLQLKKGAQPGIVNLYSWEKGKPQKIDKNASPFTTVDGTNFTVYHATEPGPLTGKGAFYWEGNTLKFHGKLSWILDIKVDCSLSK